MEDAHRGPDGSKFTAQLRPKLRNLQRQVVDSTGELFECRHPSLEAFYPGFKRLRRHPCPPLVRPTAANRRRVHPDDQANAMPDDDATIVGVGEQLAA